MDPPRTRQPNRYGKMGVRDGLVVTYAHFPYVLAPHIIPSMKPRKRGEKVKKNGQ